MDPEKAKNFSPSPQIYRYTSRDTIIYALGIGAKTDSDLHFLYENHENFQVFPTFVVAPGLLANSLSDWPGIAFDLTKILHGEQYIEIFEPLPAGEGELRSETRVLDVLDKGSGALILTEVTTYDNRNDRKLSVQQFSVFQVGAGNFGGNRASDAERKAPNVPTTTPTKIVEEKVHEDQATLYRLGGGDLNPLHIDTEFARVSGFKKPILHGLCSLGFSARAILREFGGNDASNFQAMKVRFSSPVIPGQTLVTEMWKDGRRIHFQAKVKESGKVVLSNGYVDLHVDRPAQVTEPVTQVSDLKSREVFDVISAELPHNKEAAEKVNALVLYDITKDGKYANSYTLDLRKGHSSIYEGKPKDSTKPSVTVTVDDEDFVKLATGKLEGIKCSSDCHPNSCEHLCNWLVPIALGKNIDASPKNNCQLM